MKNVWPRFMQNISKLNFYVISGKKYFTFINEYVEFYEATYLSVCKMLECGIRQLVYKVYHTRHQVPFFIYFATDFRK